MKWTFKQQCTELLQIIPGIVLFSSLVTLSIQATSQSIIFYYILCLSLTCFLIHYNQKKQTLAIIEKQLNLALSAAKMSILDWNILTNQVSWSQGHERLFGSEFGTLDGTYDFASLLHPEDREGLNQAIKRAIKEKIDYKYEYRIIWADGSIHWLENKGKTIYNKSGQAVKMTSTVRDISDVYNERHLRKIAEEKVQNLSAELEQRVLERTVQLSQDNEELSKKIVERQLLEQKLHSSETQMRGVFEAITDIVLVIDTQTGSINVAPTNPVCLHKSATDIIGKTIELIFESESNEHYLNPIQQALEKQQTINFDYSLFIDNSEVWFDASISPLLNESVIWVARDITERRAIETMKNEFISIVSHELRTPLTAIRGSLGLLSTGILNNDPQRMQRLIEIASIDTERLVRLVNDILDLERLESGKVTLVKEFCDVTTLIEQSVAAIRSLAEKEHITVSLFPISAQVWVARDSVIQVLTNLLSNAIKFSAANSAISIFAEVQDDWVLFKVKDQGRGIPSDQLELIFRRFQQVDASDSRSKGGTGLGLAICQSIVEQHGGQIWVESVLNSGSIFYFTLPVCAE
ncbi:MAG: ATP-binding protein [Coleofasciculaceae cyanobacterium]